MLHYAGCVTLPVVDQLHLWREPNNCVVCLPQQYAILGGQAQQARLFRAPAAIPTRRQPISKPLSSSLSLTVAFRETFPELADLLPLAPRRSAIAM